MEPARNRSSSALGGGTADVLVIGSTSLVGSHFVAHTRFRVAAAGRVDPGSRDLVVERFDPMDLIDAAAVGEAVRAAPEPVVVNFAARTDVDRIEAERPAAGPPQGGSAWRVNTEAAEAIARAAQGSGKHMVQISTDFVYDGRSGPYSEEASVSPWSERLSWYGWTKSAAERRIVGQDPEALIVRIAYPYREDFPPKLDFARWMLARHREGTLPALFTDQQITPTWIPDVTRALETLLGDRAEGIVHIASPTVTTPYEFGCGLLAGAEGGPPIVAGSLEQLQAVAGRAPRPVRGGLRTDRAVGMGIPLTPWRAGVEALLAHRGRS
ncbi:MAG: SDR family oxidoreductase [Thermoplasmata archaeon]